MEVKAICETLKDILKYLVSSASPSVVLSTQPVDVREVQVSLLAVWGPRGPAGPWSTPGAPVCGPNVPPPRAVEPDCASAGRPVMTTLWGRFQFRARGSKAPGGMEGRGPLSIVPP